jgi:hypothetical protein
MKVGIIECIKTCQGIWLILWYWKSNFKIWYCDIRKVGQKWVFRLQTLRFINFWMVIAFCFKFLSKCGVPYILQLLYSHFYWVFRLQTLRFINFWTVIAFCFKFLSKCGVPYILQLLYSHFYLFFTDACAMALWIQMSLSLTRFCESVYEWQWTSLDDKRNWFFIHWFLGSLLGQLYTTSNWKITMEGLSLSVRMNFAKMNG